MAKVGRKKGYTHTEEVRDKIQLSQIVNRLEKHIFSDEPLMDATQVNAAKILMAKKLPDLSAVDVNALIQHGLTDELGALLSSIAGNGKRIGNG